MRLLLDTTAYSAFMRGYAEIRSTIQDNVTGELREFCERRTATGYALCREAVRRD